MATQAERRILHIHTDDLTKLNDTQIAFEDFSDTAGLSLFGGGFGGRYGANSDEWKSGSEILRFVQFNSNPVFKSVIFNNVEGGPSHHNIVMTTSDELTTLHSADVDRQTVHPTANYVGPRGDRSISVGDMAGIIDIGSNPTEVAYHSINVGYRSGYTQLGMYTTNIGYRSGDSSSQSYSINLGYGCGVGGMGDNNISIGTDTGKNVSGEYNIYMGANAGFTHLGDASIFIGQGSGWKYSGVIDSDYVFELSNRKIDDPEDDKYTLLSGDFSRSYIMAENMFGLKPHTQSEIDAYTPITGGGSMVYNNTTGIDAPQYHNGTEWITVGASQLELITENINTGWALYGDNRSYKGDIGDHAIDLSYNTSTSTTKGATGNYSHAEGSGTTASALQSHAEGSNTLASAPQSHAEGESTIVEGIASGGHVEGYHTYVNMNNGPGTHAEGNGTSATGHAAHAEGLLTHAIGEGAHAEGIDTLAVGDFSHAGGINTCAVGDASFVTGKYNAPNSGDIFEIGVGSNTHNRANAFEVTTTGILSAPSQTITEIDSDITGKALVTKEYLVSGASSSTAKGDADTMNVSDGSGGWTATNANVNGSTMYFQTPAFDLKHVDVGAPNIQFDSDRLTAPDLDDIAITTGGDTSLVTKKYVDDNISTIIHSYAELATALAETTTTTTALFIGTSFNIPDSATLTVNGEYSIHGAKIGILGDVTITGPGILSVYQDFVVSETGTVQFDIVDVQLEIRNLGTKLSTGSTVTLNVTANSPLYYERLNKVILTHTNIAPIQEFWDNTMG